MEDKRDQLLPGEVAFSYGATIPVDIDSRTKVKIIVEHDQDKKIKAATLEVTYNLNCDFLIPDDKPNPELEDGSSIEGGYLVNFNEVGFCFNKDIAAQSGPSEFMVSFVNNSAFLYAKIPLVEGIKRDSINFIGSKIIS